MINLQKQQEQESNPRYKQNQQDGVRVLMIIQGLVFFNIKHVIWVYLIEKLIFDVYDYEMKLSMIVLYGDGWTKALLHDVRD